MKQPFRLREAIEDEIVTGRLAPGTRLEEPTLATKFGVSRTPIREALLHLAAAGLVEIRPRRGAIVSAPDTRRLVEMFECMAELEAACGRLAARRCTEADATALRKAHAVCGAAAATGDSEAYYFENAAFHAAIYRASHNAFLADQSLALHRRLAPYRRMQLRARNRIAQSLAEHAQAVEAILRGDGEAAAAVLRDHVVIQGERFADVVLSLSGASAA
jgi:DNA-binding GntR family transcriptional regulator